MTNPNLTLIGVLVDRSGSMANMASEMDQALKVFLEEQAKLPGRCEVTLAHFDNSYELVYKNLDVREVPEFHISPRYATALMDALGKFTTNIGAELFARKESDRPGKVIICVITDGYENASTQWSQFQVKNLITQQTNTYSWEFVFLGAGINAVQVAEGVGIHQGSALAFQYDTAPVAMASMGNYVSNVRRGKLASFSGGDREHAVKPANK